MSLLSLSPEEWQSAAWTILVGALTNTCCAIVGCYLVLRKMSLLGDAISHAILPGIALAFIVTGQTSPLPMLIGAMCLGLLTAVLTQSLHTLGRVNADVSLGVVFTSLFAVGVILIAHSSENVHIDPGCVLYGLLEFVSLDTVRVAGWEVPRALFPLSLTLVATLAFVCLCWKELKIASFDPALATAMGISGLVVHYLLLGMVSLVTVTAFEAVGSILVVAMLIIPAATGHLLSERLTGMMLWAVTVGVVSAVLGYAADLFWGTGIAGAMSLAAGLQFSLAALLAPRHGLVSKVWHTALLALRIASEDIIARLYRLDERASGSLAPGGEPPPRAVAGAGSFWAMARLRWRGEVERATNGAWALTDHGRRHAESLIRSHRLWESYLGEHFHIPLDHLHDPAERLEHFTGPQLQERLSQELAGPAQDPHGRKIPPGDG